MNFAKSVIATFAFTLMSASISCSHQPSKEGWDGIRDGASTEQSAPSTSDATTSDDKTADAEKPAVTPATTTSNGSSGIGVGEESKADPMQLADDKKSSMDDKSAEATPATLMPEASPAPTDTAGTEMKADTSAETAMSSPVPMTSNAVAPKEEMSAASPMPTEVTATSPAPEMATEMKNDGKEALGSPSPVEPAMIAPTASLSNDVTPSAPASVSPSMDEEKVEAPAKAEPTLVHPKAIKPKMARAKAATQVPSIPSEPVTRNGQSLNRYYFVRKGDTAVALSQKLMGNVQSEANLTKWNGQKNWKPGHMVLYSSTQSAADGEMRSFYAERGIAAAPYQVKAGDTLSTISKEKYGDIRSWVEIAVTNHVQNPNRIAAGMTLNLYSSESSLDKVAVVSEATTQFNDPQAPNSKTTQDDQAEWKPDTKPMAMQATMPAATQGKVGAKSDAKAQITAPAQVPAPPQAMNQPLIPSHAINPASAPSVAQLVANAPNKVQREPVVDQQGENQMELPAPGQVTPEVARTNAKPKSSLASMEVVRFVQRNLFMVFMALGAIGFLVYAALLKRRRTQMDTEF